MKLDTPLDFALVYAQAGFRVIPLRGKLPITEHGAHDASSDENTITQWWTQWPEANIGITLGGLVVVDVDPRNGGDLDHLPHPLPETCYAKTGGGGEHYLYSSRNGTRYPGRLAPGIDIKSGPGAYIVVEPSTHASGEQYVWLDESEPWTTKPAEAPEWLALDGLSRQRQSAASARTEPGSIAEGGRNAHLTSLAGAMRRKGMTAGAIEAALKIENEARCKPPLDDDEVARTAESVGRYEPQAEQTAAQTIVKRAPLDWAELAKSQPPAREWLIEHWLSFDATLAAGRGSIGKSLLAQQIGTALAMGVNFIDTIPAPHKVLIWNCEDDADELWRRQLAICQQLNVSMADLCGRLVIEPRRGLDNTLIATDYGKLAFTPLIAELEAQVNDYQADVLILDNTRQVFGANENDGHHATVFMNTLLGLARDRRIAPVVIAHPAKVQGSEFAGNAAWENACRMRWLMADALPDDKDAQAVDGVVYLAKRKHNYTRRDYRQLTYQDGVFVPDAVATGGMVGALRGKRAARVVIEATRLLRDKEIRLSEGSTSAYYLPTQIIKYKLAEGCTKAELSEAMRDAILEGTLIHTKGGKYGNRHVFDTLAVA